MCTSDSWEEFGEFGGKQAESSFEPLQIHVHDSNKWQRLCSWRVSPTQKQQNKKKNFPNSSQSASLWKNYWHSTQIFKFRKKKVTSSREILGRPSGFPNKSNRGGWLSEILKPLEVPNSNVSQSTFTPNFFHSITEDCLSSKSNIEKQKLKKCFFGTFLLKNSHKRNLI